MGAAFGKLIFMSQSTPAMEKSSSVSSLCQALEPVTPEKGVGKLAQVDGVGVAVPGENSACKTSPKRKLGDEDKQVATRTKVQKTVDPAKAAEKDAAKANKAELM